jgi:hypothetical protein
MKWSVSNLGITDFIPYRAKVIHDRLAVSEDGF